MVVARDIFSLSSRRILSVTRFLDNKNVNPELLRAKGIDYKKKMNAAAAAVGKIISQKQFFPVENC